MRGRRNGTSQSSFRPPLADNALLPPPARRCHQTALRTVHGSANGSTARHDALCVLASATAVSCSLRHSGVTLARCAYRELFASGFALPRLTERAPSLAGLRGKTHLAQHSDVGDGLLSPTLAIPGNLNRCLKSTRRGRSWTSSLTSDSHPRQAFVTSSWHVQDRRSCCP